MRSGWGRIAVLVVVVTGLTLSIRYREHINTDVLEQWVAELGVVGPVGFLFVYAIGVLFFSPDQYSPSQEVRCLDRFLAPSLILRARR